mgnify:FL=1|tara:strand:- start:787 stop:969 length:183 start_codon:yes stop_codon:yes gene_type:complete
MLNLLNLVRHNYANTKNFKEIRLVKDEKQRSMQTVELDEQLVPDHEHALHHLLSKERMRI